MARLSTTFITLILIFITVSSACAGSISPALQRALQTAQPEELVPAYILMRERPDPEYLSSLVNHLTRNDRSAIVWHELDKLARRSQADLLFYLGDMEAAGRVAEIESIRICNGIALRADPEVLQQIAQREDVYQVNDNALRTYPVEEPVVCDDLDELDEPSWNLERIGAVEARRDGYTGARILVAIIDTGVNWDHDDMINHLWDGGEEYPCHGWDFFDDDNDPTDTDGHGSSAAGILCGDGSAGDTTGVAPGATLMVLRVRSNLGSGVVTDTWLAQDFELQHGVDVSSMSLGWGNPNPEDRPVWRNNYNTLLAGGIISVKSAGNRSDIDPPGSISVPGDVPSPWRHPSETEQGTRSGLITIGGTTQSNEVLAASSRGPVTWQTVDPFFDYLLDDVHDGLIKPDLGAPASSGRTIARNNDQGYTTFGMTSMACPHGAGACALLLSKNPDLTPVELDSLLETYAVDLGDEGKDNTFGAGLIDVIAALDAIPVPMGTLSGTVIDVNTGEGMEGVRVEMVQRPRRHAYTDADGHYSFEAQTGGYSVRFIIPPLPEVIVNNINISEGQTANANAEIAGALIEVEPESLEAHFYDYYPEETIENLEISNPGSSQLEVALSISSVANDTFDFLEVLYQEDVVLDSAVIRGIDCSRSYISNFAMGYENGPDYINIAGRMFELPDYQTWPLGGKDMTNNGCYSYALTSFGLFGVYLYDYSRTTEINLETPLRAVCEIDSPGYRGGRDLFWGIQENGILVRFDDTGTILTQHDLDLYIDGLAWLWGDPDGYPLYMVGSTTDSVSNRLYKYSPFTHDIIDLGLLPEVDDEFNVIDLTVIEQRHDDFPMQFILAGLLQSETDSIPCRLQYWNLGVWFPWASLGTSHLSLAPDESATVPITFYCFDLRNSWGKVLLEHNTLEMETEISLHVRHHTPVEEIKNTTSLPQTCILNTPWPNPFNSVTRIPYYLPETADVRMVVYDILGREVTTLINRQVTSGYHDVLFTTESNIASGIYFIQMRVEGHGIYTQRMVYLK